MNSNRKNAFIIRIMSSDNNQRLLVIALTLMVVVLYIVIGYLFDKPGFPLDDSWIHQTYARSLAQTGRWEFVLGVQSTGSTSPLWTLLLSVGYMIGLRTPFIWTAILCIAAMAGIALVAFKIMLRLTNNRTVFSLTGALLLVLDWHLLWSSASGMETILYCFLCLLIFWLLLAEKKWLWVGCLCGLIIWVRPDGITLLGPVLLILGWKLLQKQAKFSDLIQLILPLLVLVFLYGWLNYSLSGKYFPNTFYSKQFEYAGALSLPLWRRLGQAFLVPMVGGGLFLIPGFINSIKNAIQKRSVWLVSLLCWFIGYGILYAVKLPVIYQHGRYLFPLIPAFFILGICGTNDLLTAISTQTKIIRIIKQVYVWLILCTIVFSVVGEIFLIDDLKTIDRYMVEPALWIKNNTPKDASIAVHDIGAMGYYCERKIVDLAGLVQPEMIPIIHDEEQIKEYLTNHEIDYLVVFSDWYKTMGDFGKVVITFSEKNKPEVVEVRKLSSK
jgi:hypothetical protein